MKIYLLILLLLSIGSISALGPVGEKGITVQIQNNTIIVAGYTIVQDPTGVNIKVTSDNLFINKVINSTGAIINFENISIPLIINGNYNGTNETKVPYYNYSVNYLIDIPFTSQNITNQSSLFCVSQDQYNQCIIDKAFYDAGMTSCIKDKNKMDDMSSNFSLCKDELQTTKTSLQLANSAKETATTKVTEVETKQKDTQNQVYFIGAICLAAGIFGTLYFKGHIGNRVKNPEKDFNRGTAG